MNLVESWTQQSMEAKPKEINVPLVCGLEME